MIHVTLLSLEFANFPTLKPKEITDTDLKQIHSSQLSPRSTDQPYLMDTGECWPLQSPYSASGHTESKLHLGRETE